MADSLCLRCLRYSLRSIEATRNTTVVQRAALSTTASLSAKPPAPKKGVVAKPGTRAQKTLRLSKNVRQSTGKPPAPGERKAVRKRIVLSNTNALEVEGLQDLTADKLMRHSEGTVTLETMKGQVLGFNDETVDALRALEAFKPTQGWNLFRRPASLIRDETAALANDLANVESEGKRAIRKVVFGEKGSGKSVLVLQAQAMAFLKDWVVVHFPEGQDLTNAQTSYSPLNTPSGTIYAQPHYTAKLLTNIVTANRTLLSSMQLSKQHQLPVPVQPNMSLSRFAELGAQDPNIAWPIWQALWSELTTPSKSGEAGMHRPPIFVSMDGVDQVMRMSAYLGVDAKPVHAHDLALIRDFAALLSGQTQLPNGGMILGATCASNRAPSPTLDHCLHSAHARQRNSALDGKSPKSPSTRQSLPTWDPYALKDVRVESALQDVQVLQLSGLSKQEARGVMEYYAHNGILRGAVTEGMVSEKWTLAGSGIIGELEKGSVRARF